MLWVGESRRSRDLSLILNLGTLCNVYDTVLSKHQVFLCCPDDSYHIFALPVLLFIQFKTSDP